MISNVFTGICYGPVDSRRLGRSLGVNFTAGGPKACSYDCPYCDLGPTSMRLNRVKKDVPFPTPAEILLVLTDALRATRDRSEVLDSICISGNGEPTLHPDFSEAVDAVLAARTAVWPALRVSILTNGANAETRPVRFALGRLDDRMLKLDAGNERVFKAMNGPLARTTLAKVISNARVLESVTIQTMFVSGAVDNTLQPDLEDWIEAVAIIKPKAVHLVGLNRAPWTPGLVRLDEDALYVIASKLERRTQIKALVFP